MVVTSPLDAVRPRVTSRFLGVAPGRYHPTFPVLGVCLWLFAQDVVATGSHRVDPIVPPFGTGVNSYLPVGSSPLMLRSFASGTLFGVRHGDGSPEVLALHGWARTHADFEAVLAGTDAVALDLPGFGASPPPSAAWGSKEYAAAVAAVVDESFDRAPVVLGHSMGGRVAVHLAAACPDSVRALVLTGVPLLRRGAYGARRPSAGYRLAKGLHRIGVLSDARMERLRYDRSAPDWRAAEGVMRDVFTALVNESYEEQLELVRCPVELVWGEDDTAAPVGMAEEAVTLLADGKLHRVAGVGHMTPLEMPDELRAAVERQRV